MWCQHHNGVFRSENAGADWQRADRDRAGEIRLCRRRAPARSATPPGSSRRSRTSGASRSTPRSWSPAPATAARASRCCAGACRSVTPTTWSGAMRSMSMPAARARLRLDQRRAVDLRKWRRFLDAAERGCRRSRSCASPRPSEALHAHRSENHAGPHKLHGVTRHFLNQASRAPVDCQAISLPPPADIMGRPSRLVLPVRPIYDAASAAVVLKSSSRRSTAQAIRYPRARPGRLAYHR